MTEEPLADVVWTDDRICVRLTDAPDDANYLIYDSVEDLEAAVDALAQEVDRLVDDRAVELRSVPFPTREEYPMASLTLAEAAEMARVHPLSVGRVAELCAAPRDWVRAAIPDDDLPLGPEDVEDLDDGVGLVDEAADTGDGPEVDP